VFLLIDSILFLFCLLGIYHIYLKADIPFSLENNDNLVVHKELYSSTVKKGDYLTSIDGYSFTSREQIEIYLDRKNIGELVRVSVERKGQPIEFNVKLVPFYSFIYILIVLIVSILFFLIADIVLFKADNIQQATAFHNVFVCTAVIMMTTWGNYKVEPVGIGYVIRIIFHSAYTFAPVLFLHFTMVFPVKRLKLVYLFPFYLVSLFLFLSLNLIFNQLVSSNDINYSLNYIHYFNYTRAFFVGCVSLAILNFILTYRKLTSLADRKRLKWVLLGFVIGPVSFILLWIIPQGITSNGLLPEEVILILMSAIPITFGIAIVKYHLYDIDFILNRGVVYSIAISLLTILYILIIITATSFIKGASDFASVIAAVVIALAFQSVKNRVQVFVDKKFFRIHYNFREAIKATFKKIQFCSSINALADTIIAEINKLIPSEKIGFFIYNKINNSISLLRHTNLSEFDNHKIFLSPASIKELSESPIALANYVEPGIQVTLSKSKSLFKRNIALVFPVNVSGELKGILVLGKKKSGNSYYKEDFDLLHQLSNETALEMERIILYEKIILEQLEKKKLEELNQLKSYFVSSVSHEFKTPLTSIKLFTELLEKNIGKDNPQIFEKLKIIGGESDRLSRMIDNVLDIVKIEKGIKKYQFAEVNLNEAAEDALRIMEYQFKMNKFKISKKLTDQKLVIWADKDAVVECLVNLLSNAMKYSGNEKEIEVETNTYPDYYFLIVKDKGIGICKEEITKIFQPYFRSKEKKAQRTEGTGLGLAIVKHAIDFHNGKIEIESEPNKGTSIRLYFPANKTKMNNKAY
jgi:signal transduction histidine kinase